jgi:hypothetical protein
MLATLEHAGLVLLGFALVALGVFARWASARAYRDNWKIPPHWKLPLGKSDARVLEAGSAPPT